MIAGIGCDVCEIARMEQALRNDRFLLRWFSEEERAYIGDHARAAQTAAGLFAAKEAFSKALGCGFTALLPNDITVLHTKDGAPYYSVSGRAAARMAEQRIRKVHLSLSHDGGVAMAFAVAEAGDPE